jgi:hypothetical protein
MGGTKSIEIHEIKTLGPQQTVRQQAPGCQGCPSQETAILQNGKIAAEEGESLGISIVGPETAHPGLQPVTQASQTAARHQIQNPWRPSPCQGAGQENPEIPGGSGSRIKETDTRLKRDRAFEVAGIAVFHQPMIR